MINDVCSHAYKSARTLVTYPFNMAIVAATASAYTVAAAVTLPFRALGWCQSEICGGSNTTLKLNLDGNFGSLTGGTAHSILKIINPYIETYRSNSQGDEVLAIFDNNTVNRLANSTYFFNREITTRLCYALRIPAVVVARVYDAVVGTVDLVTAALLLATDKDLNNSAFSHAFSAGKIVGDLFKCALGILNPAAY